MVDPPKDEGIDLLLQEITKNLGENQRFLQALREDRIDESEEPDDTSDAEEAFEEL